MKLMSTKVITLITVALLSTSVLAVGIGNDNPPSTGGTTEQNQGQLQGQAQGQLQGQGQIQGNINVIGIETNSRISNDVRNNATAFAGSDSSSKSSATGGAGGTSTSDATSSSGGNNLSVGGNSVVVTDSGRLHYSGKYEVKNVPNVQIANVYPTSPCMGSSAAGGSGVGFGVSFGTSWTDDECSKREAARSFAGIGLIEDAVAILCSTEAAVVAPSCKPKE